MKIIFAISSMGSGGAERTIANLANYLINEENEILIAVLDGNDSFYELDKRIIYKKLKVYKKKNGLIGTIDLYKKSINKIRILLKEYNPDVLLCMNYKVLTMIILANIFINIPIIGSERSNPYVYPSSEVWKMLRKIASIVSDGYIFQSERAKEYFPRGVQKKGKVIENPINITYIDSFKKEYISKMQIVSVGRLERVKGFDVLIRAFKIIADEVKDINLVIYGEGSERVRLEGLIKELNLTNRVFLPGKCTDVIEKINGSKAFILSSRNEGMPNSLIEALSLGIPCISTRCDIGPEELIEDGINGLLVEVDNIEEMSKAIKNILSDKELADRLSVNGLKIKEKNSIEKISARYYVYFEKVIKRKNQKLCLRVLDNLVYRRL